MKTIDITYKIHETDLTLMMWNLAMMLHEFCLLSQHFPYLLDDNKELFKTILKL